MDTLNPNQFQGVDMSDIPIVEDLLTIDFLLYDKDFVDGKIIGEPARRNLQKHGKTVQILRYNNHISYLSDINALLQFFRAPRVTHSSTRHSVWNEIQPSVVNE